MQISQPRYVHTIALFRPELFGGICQKIFLLHKKRETGCYKWSPSSRQRTEMSRKNMIYVERQRPSKHMLQRPVNKRRSSRSSRVTRALSGPQGHSCTDAFRCSARCVKKGAADEASGVDAGLCDQEETPPRAQVCFLACPRDCVTSAWGPWSSCPLVRTNDCPQVIALS